MSISCPVLGSLSEVAAAVAALPVPSGLGAQDVLAEQVQVLAETVAGLQRQLAVRMAAWERESPPAVDVRGRVVAAGVDARRSRLLRVLGRFAAGHPDLQRGWLDGEVSLDQVEIVRAGAARLAVPQEQGLVAAVLPELPGLDARATRRLVEELVDRLAPGDPDLAETAEQDCRRLAWARTPGGGIVLDGYLPAPQAEAFTGAVTALVESLRVQGDQLTGGQRRADALAALVDRAGAHGLPAAGGLPPAMTLTVSLSEAARIAAADPADFARLPRPRPRGGSQVGDQPAGDATVRFGLCCAAITPILAAPIPTQTAGPGAMPGAATPIRAGGPAAQDGASLDVGERPQVRGGQPSMTDVAERGGGGGGGGENRQLLRAGGTGPSGGGGNGHKSGTAGGGGNGHRESRTAGQDVGAGCRGGHGGIGGIRERASGGGGTGPGRPGSLIARIADTPTHPIAVGRSVRLATPAQRQALRLRDQGCVIPGCDIEAGYTQPHHVTGWALDGPTDLTNLVSLCVVHHQMTELGYFHFHPRTADSPAPPGAHPHPHWWITPRG